MGREEGKLYGGTTCGPQSLKYFTVWTSQKKLPIFKNKHKTKTKLWNGFLLTLRIKPVLLNWCIISLEWRKQSERHYITVELSLGTSTTACLWPKREKERKDF